MLYDTSGFIDPLSCRIFILASRVVDITSDDGYTFTHVSHNLVTVNAFLFLNVTQVFDTFNTDSELHIPNFISESHLIFVLN